MASSWAGYGPSAPPLQQQSSEPGPSKKKIPQARQLLSCTKCRERKVKVSNGSKVVVKLSRSTNIRQCDRCKPCSACCARGHPKECKFIVGEGNDYSPIQQSYEIRELRRQNQQLRQQLRDAQIPQSADEDDDEGSPDHGGAKPTSRATAARQRRFRTTERTDNIYFGTPGLASIVSDVGIVDRWWSTSLTYHPVRQPADRQSLPHTHCSQRPRDVQHAEADVPIPHAFDRRQHLCSSTRTSTR